jgi:hypothetical protein
LPCKQGEESRKAVFSATERFKNDVSERRVFYCGLGKKDCILVQLRTEIASVDSIASAAYRQAAAGPCRY